MFDVLIDFTFLIISEIVEWTSRTILRIFGRILDLLSM